MEHVEHYPKIIGTWQNEVTKFEIFINQNGPFITSTHHSSSHCNHLAGEYAGDNQFTYKVVRVSRVDGCKTTMNGSLTLHSDNLMTTKIIGTDGKCDLGTEFTETIAWYRLW